jgi:predicted glycosyltransferase
MADDGATAARVTDAAHRISGARALRILIDIGHPAHVHFFKNPIRLLEHRGHNIVVTSRDKEMALQLLDGLGLEHREISAKNKGGLASLGNELLTRNYRLAKIVRAFKPKIMAAIGGVSIAQVGRLLGVPSLVFYDTENARLQNAITYPFASCVIVPRCYEAWVPKHRHLRYDGYHELSYLHPRYFKADRELAISNGLASSGDTFFIRVVSWEASHDIGERGWTGPLLSKLVRKLSAVGKVLISAEGPLGDDLESHRYVGDVKEVHHVLAHCRAFVGESATMASECAVLGVPAIYAAQTGRGYTNEQESRYGLVTNLRLLDWGSMQAAVDRILARPIEHWQTARQALLDTTIDVAEFVARCTETFPALPNGSCRRVGD